MLIVTANWAFTDGTLAGPDRRQAERAWLRRVRLAVVHAGFGRDGAYRPPDGLDILLAGDTFDTQISAAWCGRHKPWQADPRSVELRGRVLRGCMHRAAPLLAGLARLARRGVVVPAADARARPSTLAAVPVPVRVAFLVGDRDRHLAVTAADVAARGGLVAPAWSDGIVVVRHGHEHDPACHVDDQGPHVDRPPSLAESVAVDLVAGFAAAVGAAGVHRRAVASLLDALSAAPPLDLPVIVESWVLAQDRGGAIDAATRRAVRATWRRAVDAWVRAARCVPPDCGVSASPVEALAAWFSGTGTGAPPGGLVSAFAPPAHPPAVRAAGTGEGRRVVLGHAPAVTETASAVCLGRSMVRPWRPIAVVRGDGMTEVSCVAAGTVPAEPATIAGLESGGRLRWWPIAGGDLVGAAPDADDSTVVDAA